MRAEIDTRQSMAGLIVVTDFSNNTGQNLALVTRDKVEICLMKHIHRMESHKAWIAPFGIFVTVVATLCTSSFQDIGPITASTLQAFYLMAALLSFIYFLIVVPGAFKSSKIEDVVNEITKGSSTPNVSATVPNSNVISFG